MMTLFPMEIPAIRPAMRREAVLAPGEVQGVEAGRAIQVLEGVVWVTQEGDGGDHVLTAGSVLRLRSRGRVVMQALRGPARYKLQA